MYLRHILAYLWKLPLCGLAFFVGMALSGILLPALGFTPPEMPAGTDAGTITLWFLIGSMLLAAFLAPLSRRLQAGRLARWLLLSLFVWVFAAVGMVLESFFFMTTGAVTSLENALFTTLNFLLPAFFLGGMVASLFRPTPDTVLAPIFVAPTFQGWLWRALTALLAYPLIYFSFGLLVQPLIGDYYASGQYELITPTWGQMIPLQMARSLLFLLVSLPIIARWHGARRALWLSLGLAIFACTSFMAVLTAYWFPWQMRLFHGLELLADGLLYAGVLTWLFTAPTSRK
ncbi:MAG: hypothetical protein ACOY16_01610 [Chloroflexota bacterium]